MRAHTTQSAEFTGHELVESDSSAVDVTIDRAVSAEGRDWTESDGALQPLYLRERCGLGGHRHAGGYGALLQLPESASQLYRAHEDSEAVPQTGGGLSDQLVLALAAPREQLPEQIRAHPGSRVSGGVVAYTEQCGLLASTDGGVRPGTNRRQVALVREQSRANLLPRLGLRQLAGERSKGDEGAGEPAYGREWLRFRRRRKHELLLLLLKRLRLRDGLIRFVAG